MVTYNNITNKNEIRRCSLNTNMNPTSPKSNSLAPTTLRKTSNVASKLFDDEDETNELRDEFMKSKLAQTRSASIASSSPSQIKEFTNPKISKNTPYYQHFRQLAKEVEQEEEKGEDETTQKSNKYDDDDTSDAMETLKRLMERRRNGNTRSYSLNDSNTVPYISRKYSAQITPVAGIREVDESSES